MSRPIAPCLTLRFIWFTALAALCTPFVLHDATAAPVLADSSALSFDMTGAKVGEQLPDLTVYTLDGKPARFSDAWDGVVVTASLTCPKSREKYPELRDLAAGSKGAGRFAILYVIEAHPDVDPSPYKGIVDVTPANRRDGILFRQATTLDERLKLAREFRDRMKVPAEIAIYVDGMANDAWKHVGGGPNMGLLVDDNGIVRARQGWFNAAALKPAADAMATVQNRYARAEESIPSTLHDAAKAGQAKKVDVLLELTNADPNKPAPNGPTPLQEALLYNRGEVAERLLAAGAKTNAFSSAALGEVSVVKRLIDADATVARRRDGWGRDLLDYAAACGRIEMAKLLLSYGVVDDRPAGSQEPIALHWAARNGQASMAALLLDEAGADPNAKDRDGRTPVDYADESANSASPPRHAAATLQLLRRAAGEPVKPVAPITPKPSAATVVP